MTSCNNAPIWSTFASLGISLLFAIRKKRRQEALDKARAKSVSLMNAIRTMQDKHDSQSR